MVSSSHEEWLQEQKKAVSKLSYEELQAKAMIAQQMADVRFTFAEGGRVRLGFGPAGRVGTYVVDKVEGTALHITTTTGTGDDRRARERVGQGRDRLRGARAPAGLDGRTEKKSGAKKQHGRPVCKTSRADGESEAEEVRMED